MMHYYETAHREAGATYPTITAHNTLEEAISFAESHNIDLISEIGGSYTDYEPCFFCGEWFPSEDLTEEIGHTLLCDRCQKTIQKYQEG